MTSGIFSLVRYAGLPLLRGDACSQPWWWSRLAQLEERVKNIVAAAASDRDGMTAPRDLWPTWKEDELEAWFADRREKNSQPRPLQD